MLFYNILMIVIPDYAREFLFMNSVSMHKSVTGNSVPCRTLQVKS